MLFSDFLVASLRDTPSPKESDDLIARLWDMEKHLGEVERRLNETQSLARIGSWEWDLITDEVSGSPELLRLLGFAPDGPMPDAETLLRRFSTDDREAIMRTLRLAVADGGEYEMELRLLPPDRDISEDGQGTQIRYLHATGQRLTEEAGVRITGTLQDITEHRAATLDRDASEKALQEAVAALLVSEERYALALDGARDGIWDVDLNTGITFFSSRWKEIAGYETSEQQSELTLGGNAWIKRVHPDDRLRIENEAMQSLQNGTNLFHIEYRMRRLDDSIIWVVTRGKILRTPEGKPYRVVGATTDISERKASEESLRLSEARFRALALTSTMGIWRTDSEGRSATGAPIWAAFTGQHKPDTTGVSWLEAIHPEDRTRVYELWMSSLEQARNGENIVSDRTFRVRRHDGVDRYLQARGVPVRDEAGQVREWVGTFNDVTEQIETRQETARQAERNRQIARTLEQSLVPPVAPDRVPGMEIRTFHLPCGIDEFGDEVTVGGDFYDVFPLTGDRWAFVLGDVMGKGLAAALSIAEVRFALRGFLHEGGGPATVLSRLNRFLLEARRLEDRPRNVLVALALVVLHVPTQTLTASVAGAEAPLIVSPYQPIRVLDHGGLILGADPASDYHEVSAALSTGDVLTLTTDGLTEARGPSGLFGTENISRILAEDLRSATPALDRAGRNILAAAEAWATNGFKDDICLVLLRTNRSDTGDTNSLIL